MRDQCELERYGDRIIARCASTDDELCVAWNWKHAEVNLYK